jgi:hypothetical protein
MPIDTTTEQKAREALARNPFPLVPWIRIRDDGIAIVTGYSEALHRLLRWVPNARWRQSERCWIVPFSGAEAIRAVLPEITRLAEAAQELDDPVSPRGASETAARPDLLTRFIEAAALLHGPDWRVTLRETAGDRIADWIDGRSVPDAADPLLADLAAKLRQKAAALTRAADQLEAAPAGAQTDSGP